MDHSYKFCVVSMNVANELSKDYVTCDSCTILRIEICVDLSYIHINIVSALNEDDPHLIE